jgi:hypothetical protein
MAMTECPECDKPVSSSAKTCPQCGHKLRMGLFGKLIIGAVLAFCGVMLIGLLIPENVAKANAARRACENEMVPSGQATLADCERLYLRIKGN